MQANKRLFSYLIIFFALQLVLLVFLLLLKDRNEKKYITSQLQLFEKKYRSTINSFSRLARLTFDETINVPDVVDLFAEAAVSQSHRQQELHKELYQRLQPVYFRMKSRDVRQVHFHLADGTSFLRMHLPEEYGDKLFTVREGVWLANKEQKYVEGFELGRHFHAYRYIFPLAKDGVHLGTVEISFPFYATSFALKETNEADYFLILKKEILDRKLFSESLQNYISSPLVDGYLNEKQDLELINDPYLQQISEERLAKIIQNIKKETHSYISQGGEFGLSTKVEEKDFLILFLPLTNIDSKNVGYLITMMEDNNLASLRNGFFVAYILSSFLIIVIFFLHDRATKKLFGRIQFQQNLIDSIPTPIFYKDKEGLLLGCNSAFAQIFAVKPKEIIGKASDAYLPAAFVEVVQENGRQEINKNPLQKQESSMRYADGSEHDIVAYHVVAKENNKPMGIIGSLFDVTDLKKTERALKQSFEELDIIFNTAANAMRVVDKNHIIIRANEMFLKLTGLPMQDVIGKKCYEVFPGLACHTENCPLEQVQHGVTRFEEEVEKTLPDGSRMDCIVTSVPYYDQQGRLAGIVEDFKDITKHKELEKTLRSIAITDELTGLFNRRGFKMMAGKQLQTSKRAGLETYLLYGDLDNMKSINDTFGHDVGDEALRVTAELLQKTFRKADAIGRLGGDEFAVLTSCEVGKDNDKAMMKRLKDNIAYINETGMHHYQLSVSIGLVKYDNEDLEAFIKRADQLMYMNKIKKKSSDES